MAGVDRAWKTVHVPVKPAFCEIETTAARKHDVRALEQFLFTLDDFSRRVLEERKLVHAVVDATGFHVARETERHRSVIPQQRFARRSVRYVQLVEKCALDL